MRLDQLGTCCHGTGERGTSLHHSGDGAGRERWRLGLRELSDSCSVMSNTLRRHGLYSLWNSPGRNTGVGILSLLQGIFPGIEPRSSALQVDSLPAEKPGKP